jgi:hypothetical protein
MKIVFSPGTPPSIAGTLGPVDHTLKIAGVVEPTTKCQGLFFFAVLGLELRAYTLSHSTSLFCDKFFLDRTSRTIHPGWLPTTILLLSAS